MPQVQSYIPGVFCWCEANTSDQPAGKVFYEKVFGWQSTDSPFGPGAFYTNFSKDGQSVAGLLPLNKAQLALNIPPHWNLYLNVENVDQSTARAALLGATVLAEGFDVMEVGRMSIIQDPCGAIVYLWQKGHHFGAAVVDEPGAFCWYELVVKEPEKAIEFYGQLFGWTAKVSPEYTEFHLGDIGVGGLFAAPDVPPNWMPYVMVADINAASALAAQEGGTILIGPGKAGEHGVFCVILDPQGAALGLYQRVS